jgi:hypothetical protein
MVVDVVKEVERRKEKREKEVEGFLDFRPNE